MQKILVMKDDWRRKKVSGNMFQIRELQDVVEGFIDNMSDKEIDENMKFFGKVARHFHLKSYDHVAMVTGSEEWMLSKDNAPEGVLALNPVFELRNGIRFAYFKDMEDAEKGVEILEKTARIELGEELGE